VLKRVELLERIRLHAGPGEAIVDRDAGIRLTYQELLDRVEATSRELAALQSRALTFLLSTNTADFVVLYLACLQASLPAVLVDPNAPLAFLLETYRPSLLLAPERMTFEGFASSRQVSTAGSYLAWQCPGPRPVHEDLAILLPTSGSTGSPKLVRLREANLSANAVSIAQYLDLGPGERAIQSLPMYYSYGLSVLNSHLVAGGTVILTSLSFILAEFWAIVDGEHCTSFAGIPYMYETLHRLRFDPAGHPSLRTLTQAGGGLGKALISHFHESARKAGARLVVMYGQTEATARISFVPPERLAEKIGSIGIAIPGGRLTLRDVPGMETGREMIYAGPNVMMGYAECAEHLLLGDVLGGVLETGDLAVQDEDGFFHLVGRLNRFAKLFGRRISLEDV
jgi:acyl-CoA synthetase (AMP-forming)/AMP-acid ligase II